MNFYFGLRCARKSKRANPKPEDLLKAPVSRRKTESSVSYQHNYPATAARCQAGSLLCGTPAFGKFTLLFFPASQKKGLLPPTLPGATSAFRKALYTVCQCRRHGAQPRASCLCGTRGASAEVGPPSPARLPLPADAPSWQERPAGRPPAAPSPGLSRRSTAERVRPNPALPWVTAGRVSFR